MLTFRISWTIVGVVILEEPMRAFRWLPSPLPFFCECSGSSSLLFSCSFIISRISRSSSNAHRFVPLDTCSSVPSIVDTVSPSGVNRFMCSSSSELASSLAGNGGSALVSRTTSTSTHREAAGWFEPSLHAFVTSFLGRNHSYDWRRSESFQVLCHSRRCLHESARWPTSKRFMAAANLPRYFFISLLSLIRFMTRMKRPLSTCDRTNLSMDTKVLTK